MKYRIISDKELKKLGLDPNNYKEFDKLKENIIGYSYMDILYDYADWKDIKVEKITKNHRKKLFEFLEKKFNDWGSPITDAMAEIAEDLEEAYSKFKYDITDELKSNLEEELKEEE